MSWIVYRTINLIDGKFYIGVHRESQTKRSKDYRGSSLIVKADIKRLGLENFERETLFRSDEENAEELCYFIEEHLVNKETLQNPQCYNLVLGGMKPPNPKGKKYSESHKKNISVAAKESWKDGKRIQHRQTEETRNKMRGNQNWKFRKTHGRPKGPVKEKQVTIPKFNPRMLGKTHSEETKNKMRIAALHRWSQR